jgi:hypothetical protein
MCIFVDSTQKSMDFWLLPVGPSYLWLALHSHLTISWGSSSLFWQSRRNLWGFSVNLHMFLTFLRKTSDFWWESQVCLCISMCAWCRFSENPEFSVKSWKFLDFLFGILRPAAISQDLLRILSVKSQTQKHETQEFLKTCKTHHSRHSPESINNRNPEWGGTKTEMSQHTHGMRVRFWEITENLKT